VLIEESDMVGYLDQLIHHQDEPIADWVCVPLYFVSKLAKDSGVTVVQVGEGSDEQFCGYGSYMEYLRLHRQYWTPFRRFLPSPLRHLAAGVARHASDMKPGLKIYADVIDRAARDREHFWSGATVFWDLQKKDLIDASRVRPSPGLHKLVDCGLLPASYLQPDSFNVVGAFYDRIDEVAPGSDVLTRMIYSEFKLRLPELLLMRVDKIGMSVSIEARVPFLDHKLVEFTMDVPMGDKVPGHAVKHLLKTAVRGLIPDPIIDRKKMGFGAPMSDWMRGPFGAQVESVLLGSSVFERLPFDRAHIRWLITEHREGGATTRCSFGRCSTWRPGTTTGSTGRRSPRPPEPVDLIGTARRALKKPPRYIAERAWTEAVRVSDRWRAPARAAALTDRALLAALGYASIDEAWAGLLARPYPFVPAGFTREALDAVAPGMAERILRQAEDALAHRIDLLGSGPIELGPVIDWHADYKTGRRWPPAYCHAIDYANLDEPSDVKSPWELSRLHWLIPAAQAWRLTGEERYAAGVRAVLESWIEANPYAGSVNWSCTMEPALRLLSFTWFVQACAGSAAFTDSEFRAKLLRSLYLHADFTDRYIERSDVNGNHYTADAAGLVFAGLFLGDGADARRWLQTGWSILTEEVERQVFADGVDFEASIPYHRLVMELFLLPALYGQAHGRRLPPVWRERLVAMAGFTAAYSRNDGGVPVWGDNDDARALPMAGKGLADHRYLIALTALGLDEAALLDRFSGPVDEVAGLLGPEAARGVAGQPPPPRHSEAFAEGGFYILAGGDDHVLVDCGPLGLAGRGGHGHNDLMSFEAALLGQCLVVDPGSYVYTSSPADRNAFRSTAYHNTPQLAGAEINRLIRPDYLWNLHNDAEPEVRAWRPGPEVSAMEMSHSGYARLSPPVRPVRSISLDHARHTLTIVDTFEGGGYAAAIPLHLAPEVQPASAGSSVRLHTPTGDYTVRWEADGDWTFAVEPARIAPSYGVLQPSHRLVWRCPDCQGARLRVEIGPADPR
jgi:hypothetical protein